MIASTSMKLVTVGILSLALLTSCASAAPSIPTEVVTLVALTSTPRSAKQTETPAILPTHTPLPQSPTVTAIPCDSLTTDFCVTSGHFLFQTPILPPDNDLVDNTYLYGSTQNGKREPHHGVEFQNAYGTSVYAAGDGVVVFADSDKAEKLSTWTNFYGNVVLILHEDGLYTLYAHLSKILVQREGVVSAGDKIGEVGQTGGATGSHLHFEVRRGGDGTDYFSTENPELWLIPQADSGTISITFERENLQNIELPLVISRYLDGNTNPIMTRYITSYAKGFEHNAEDAVLGSLPAGQYKIAFTDISGLHERMVTIEAGKLTEVVFEVK